MTQRKEMVPADTPGLCGPEWKLLCSIRTRIKLIMMDMKRARDMRVHLIAIIAQMDEVFEDWPEDPK